AEDGIRDPLVTGVQTCALPIWREQATCGREGGTEQCIGDQDAAEAEAADNARRNGFHRERADRGRECHQPGFERRVAETKLQHRSEERRVGKEWRARW